MPYNPSKLPSGPGADYSQLGLAGALVTPSDTTDFDRYTRIRVWAPEATASPKITVLPARNADEAPITLDLPPGLVSVLEYVVRRVLSTGTTAGLVIHTID
jgi:hypothetical protein